MADPAALSAAIAAWIDAIGAEHVRTDAGELARAGATTHAWPQRALAVLRPADHAQVAACLAIASRHRVPLHPYSSGLNWGYGSRTSIVDAVHLDLRRLDRILDYDDRLGWVRVEAGVTQAALHRFLEERGGRFWLDATGSSSRASVLSNALERGFGHTPYGDHFQHACDLHVALPDGGSLRTGFGCYGDGAAKAAPVYRWGLGPVIDGLFAQSSLGVATAATLWLMPAPERWLAVAIAIERDEGLAPLIEALRPLRLDGTLRSAMHIVNDYKVVGASGEYPWEEAGGATPLPPAVLASHRRRMGFGAWNALGCLYGSKARIADDLRRVRRAVRGVASRCDAIDDGRLRLAERLSPILSPILGRDIRSLAASLRPVLGLMRGIPTDHFLRGCYWRKRDPPPERPDPDRDGCGLLWLAPVAPATGADARAVADLARSILLRHAFEPQLSFTLLTERAISCVIQLTWDRAVDGEDARARACYDELLARTRAAGYPPYRLGTVSQGDGWIAGDRKGFLAKLRGAIDPAGALDPGRYGC